ARRGRASRWVDLRTKMTVKGRPGPNTISFNARRRGFAPGRYRLTVRATDLSGKRSSPSSVRFQVASRSRSHAKFAAFSGAIGGLSVFTRLS
ncbi:MAG: hypothetical protein ACXWWO_05890, partial [Candidatus Limnocylindria bacterium]